MWTPWQRRREPVDGLTIQHFATAVKDANAREAGFHSLFDQLSFALRMADSTVPIDRATVPLSLTLGPAKIKELSAQIKLSPFLRNNVQALVHHYREDMRDLQAAQRAVALGQEQPALHIRPEAVQVVASLFHFVSASREQFRDYPAFYELFGPMGTSRLELPARQPIPEELQFFLAERAPADKPGALAAASTPEAAVGGPEGLLPLIAVPALALEVGVDLVPLVDPAMGGDLLDRMVPIRLAVALETGFVMPGVQFKDSPALGPNAYQLRVRGNVVAEGELMVGLHLAIEGAQTEESAALMGFPTSEPVNNRPATWVTRAEAQRASKLGFTVLDATHALAAHLEAVVRAHAHELLTLDEVAAMVEHLRATAPQAVGAVLPAKLELAVYHQILGNLLAEGVSIRDQVTILETLAHGVKPLHPLYLARHAGERDAAALAAAQSRPLDDPTLLTELVRSALARQICASLADPNGTLEVILLSAPLEQLLTDALQLTPQGPALALSPLRQAALVERIAAECDALDRPILLCDAHVRPFVKPLLTRTLPKLAVLTHAELHPSYKVQTIGTVELVES